MDSLKMETTGVRVRKWFRLQSRSPREEEWEHGVTGKTWGVKEWGSGSCSEPGRNPDRTTLLVQLTPN